MQSTADMGNACQCCASRPSVLSPPHDEGSSLPSPPPQPLIIPSSPLPILTTSSPPLSIDSLIQSIKQVNPTDEIDSLLNFIEDRLRRIKDTPEKASTSSSLLDSVTSTTTLAAKVVDTITTEAEKLASTDMVKEMGRLALSGLNMVGEAHLLLLGLSVAAHALERCVTMKSNDKDCIDLLQAIAFLAKDLKQFKEAMPGESERLSQAVQMIVEGAIICCDYINKGGVSRYWSATTTQAQVVKTNQSIRDIRTSLGFPINLDVHKNTRELVQNTKELLRTATVRLEESPLKLLDFEPVGIDTKVEDVKSLLALDGTEPALAVVLCGFGGVGKSTLAASVIQNLYQTQPGTCAGFKFCRVIINDKTADEISHIKQLQRDMISDFGGGRQDLRNPEEGRRRLHEVMENKWCLLFIDNVVDKKYVQKLLPKDLKWFNKSENMLAEDMGKPKSKLRIFITSREKNLRPEFNITCKEYDVHAFSNQTSRCLLRETILQSDQKLRDNFEEIDLMNAVADACRGVPILLSVFGKHLRDNRKAASYKEALESLRQGNLDSFADEDLSKQLFFVYSKLSEEDQEAFLDICKYFNGWQWNLVCRILDEGRVENLQRKMLINKSDLDVVNVHDILRIMGEKESRQTRISNYKELLQLLEDGEENLKNVKGISLVENESSITLEYRHLNATCQSLRVLMIGDWVRLDGLPCKGSFQNLRCLSVGDVIDFPIEDVSKLHKLTALSNSSKRGMNLDRLPPSLKIISHHVPDSYGHSFENLPLAQNLPSLQSFIVESRMLVKLPEKFGLPSSLIDLQLNCCRQLPKEFSNLAALERLTLDKCDFEFLPRGMGKLKKLKHLSLQHCTMLASLPEELGLLSSMTCLRLQGCTLLKNLPDDLGKLSALEELNMRDCQNLRELPQNFGGLSSLQKLDLTGCSRIESLPESFAKLRIESLTLESLLSLAELPYCFGNMAYLSHLKLKFCNSLSTLPSTFVQLKCLETLHISYCSKIVELPGDFGQLSVLSELYLKDCPKLEKLPDGFQALPALKMLHLIGCSSLVSLPSGFGELICLEYLFINGSLISRLPDGFGKLKRLETLIIQLGYKLETFPDDFETLSSLTSLKLHWCPKLNGAAMERIIKLQHCYCAVISKSTELIKRWEEMREEVESPMAVLTKPNVLDWEEKERAARVSLSRGKCIQLDESREQLIERSTSMLFEEDTTVALIALPLHMEFNHHQLIQRLVGVAMEKAKAASKRRRLRIVYVKRVKQKGETTEQERKEEEDCFRQILKSMPIGSFAIPCTDRRRHRLITYIFFDSSGYRADNKLACRLLNVGVDDKDHKFVKFIDKFGEDDISGEAIQSSESLDKEDIISNRIGNFIESICSGRFSGTDGPPNESRFTEFLRILKENSAGHLIDSKLNLVQLDQLKTNVVGIFISDLNTSEYIKLEQIYKELKFKGHNFEMIWIPLLKNVFYGRGTYTRAIQKMSWTVLPNPNMVKLENKNPHCIIFDQGGNITNQDALSAMMSWGVEVFPFTQSKINRIVSTTHAESCLNFLFNELNLVDKGVIENKLTFLYAEPPSSKLKMKFSLEQLEQVHNNVQIIYVGHFFVEEFDLATFKDIYEDVIQEMHWHKLSFEDMVTFWYRCKYLFEENEDKLDMMTIELKSLARFLYIEKRWLVVLDSDGVVTKSGYEMVKIICKPDYEKRDEVDVIMKNELLESLQLRKCNQIVRTFFKDIINHPKHSQHHLRIDDREFRNYYCNSCYFAQTIAWNQQRRYRCNQCDWDLCIKCWELLVKGEVQRSHQE
ncbi:uncharacterized protein LOC131053404 [Cryptomeria japonica]|uniref:uncharacterized protein LOC131053404 n=1 Tax=Cryptomeria japonica TaxID=3369 RepID=UPI0027DA4389|nr:uncharacterized protein LOC131053404 [Cryptomeria japonica]